MWVFFQEVMIISRKNGPVCAGEEAIFLLSNYCEGPESRATDGRAASRARAFVELLLSAAFVSH